MVYTAVNKRDIKITRNKSYFSIKTYVVEGYEDENIKHISFFTKHMLLVLIKSAYARRF